MEGLINSIDHLGDSGRELIKACVKVRSFNKHEVHEYSQDETTEKISGDDCSGIGCSVDEVVGEASPMLLYDDLSMAQWNM